MPLSKTSNTISLSIIVPVHNESAGLSTFHTKLVQILKANEWNFEIIYIDDGSTDNSAELIKKFASDNTFVKPIFLSRNFGKEVATTAGLHAAKAKAAIMIDADGQHPIELIPEFVRKWQEGAQVVIGVRTANQKEGNIKKIGSKLFYRMLRLLKVPDIMPGSTDFRLIDQQVVIAFAKLSEHNRVTRALIDWLGFDRKYIRFKANAREHGDASYSHKKLIQLALNGFVSLSFTPLYFSGYMGVVITFLGILAGLFAIVEKYLLNDPLKFNITGTAILGLLVLVLVGILLIGQGLLAIYVARMYAEVQNRPLYITKD